MLYFHAYSFIQGFAKVWVVHGDCAVAPYWFQIASQVGSSKVGLSSRVGNLEPFLGYYNPYMIPKVNL